MKSSLQSRPRSQRSLFLAAILAGMTWVGCSDQAAGPPTSPADSPDLSVRAGRPAAVQQQDLGPALAAQKRHGPQLMAIPGVVGHGVGLVDGEPGIKVFLLKPGVAGVPSRLNDVPVAVEVTGMFVADELNNPQTRERPAPNGFSIGHPNITAGTLGAIVKDGFGVCYALSNNHVLANSNDASIGDSSLQPGPFDGGKDPADAIGTLFAFKPIAFDGLDNDIDAAISQIFSTEDITAATPPYAYGAPGTTVVTATVGLGVKKFGRTTGLTYGAVDAANVTVDVCYKSSGPFRCKKNKLARFTNLVSIPDATATDASGDPADFSAGGDSGSLIVTESDDNKPTAHLFAGSSTRTLATQIGPVLSYFSVDVEPNKSNCTNDGGEPTPVTDVAVPSVSAPSSAVVGDVVSVDVTVENVGNQDVVADIQVILKDETDNVSVGTQTIIGGLTAGSSTTLIYSWNIPESASIGNHTLTATQQQADDDGGNDSGSTNVTVNDVPPGSTTMHVADLDASAVGSGPNWTGTVTVEVRDTGGNAVSNATVSGDWSVSGSGSSTICTTGSDARCSVSSGTLRRRNGSTTFTVSDVERTLTYDADANSDPDGDSDGTSITVNKP